MARGIINNKDIEHVEEQYITGREKKTRTKILEPNRIVYVWFYLKVVPRTRDISTFGCISLPQVSRDIVDERINTIEVKREK